MSTFLRSIELTTINCGVCGGSYAINEAYRLEKYQTGGSWNCPYCRVAWGYANNSENARLKRDLEWQKARVTREEIARKHAEDERDTAESRRRAEKAAKTRIKNRIANGVCPCCNRSFVDLHRHMETKHPGYAGDRP